MEEKFGCYAKELLSDVDDEEGGGEIPTLRFHDILALAVELQKAKNKTYKDSWKKNGEFLSAFENVSRKYDRIHNVVIDYVENSAPLPKGDASIAQGLMDLLVYAGLWLTLVAEKRPNEFIELLESIVKSIEETSK